MALDTNEDTMALTINIRYTGAPGAALGFAREMESKGVASAVRAEEGNLRYEYFQALADPDTVLLVDQWANQAALDAHHATPMMARIAELRDKYDLHMSVERYVDADGGSADDDTFVRY